MTRERVPLLYFAVMCAALAVAACSGRAHAADGCTSSDCVTAGVTVLKGRLPTCNYSRTGRIQQDGDAGVYICSRLPDGGQEWNRVGGPAADLWREGPSVATVATNNRRQVVFPMDGGIATPGGAFEGDLDTGWTWFADNRMAIVSSGGTRGFVFGGGNAGSASIIYGSTDNAYVRLDGTGSTLVYGGATIGSDSEKIVVAAPGGIRSIPYAFASFLTCNSGRNGSLQIDATSNKLRMCDAGGSSWHVIAQQWTISGYVPSHGTAASNIGPETVAASPGIAYSMHVRTSLSAGNRTGGNTVIDLYDTNATTSLCSLTIACGAGSGATTSCTGAVVAGNTLRIRVDQSACTGGSADMDFNVVAGVKGGL